jgi:hypothetical protein
VTAHVLEQIDLHMITAWRIVPDMHSHYEMLHGGRDILYNFDNKSPFKTSFPSTTVGID